jgi:hypothetical protein
MTKFSEGQEVEVRSATKPRQANWLWRKATIVYPPEFDGLTHWCLVQFPDNTRGAFAVKQIRLPK